MRISVRLLGLDLFSLEVTTDEAVEDDKARDLSGGTLTALPVGFTARFEHLREDDGKDYE